MKSWATLTGAVKTSILPANVVDPLPGQLFSLTDESAITIRHLLSYDHYAASADTLRCHFALLERLYGGRLLRFHRVARAVRRVP